MKKSNWKGDEFKPGEVVECIEGAMLEIIRWTKEYGGWWYCRIIKNGGMCYTRLIREKQISEIDCKPSPEPLHPLATPSPNPIGKNTLINK
jgi:hypothetical protein